MSETTGRDEVATNEPIRGFETPNWAPLERVLPDEEWPCSCGCTPSARFESYKHPITRQYLILDGHGDAHSADEDGTLRPVRVGDALGIIADELERLGWAPNATSEHEAARLEQRRASYARHHPPHRQR